jgi:hypothetical protein
MQTLNMPMDGLYIKPREGLKVCYPDRPLLLPESGALVTANLHYWHRRLRDGDVILINERDAACQAQ